jgi:tetratricopeptide (TPR) repeat protein
MVEPRRHGAAAPKNEKPGAASTTAWLVVPGPGIRMPRSAYIEYHWHHQRVGIRPRNWEADMGEKTGEGQSGGISSRGTLGSVGGDIVGRDKIGLDEREIGRRIDQAQRPVTEKLDALMTQIAREKGVEIAPLRIILSKLGEAGVSDQEISARLDKAVGELIELRSQLSRLNNDRPEFAVIRDQALAHIDQGDFDAARTALVRGRESARALRESVSNTEAEFLADEARIDHLQLAYRAAAEKFAQAAALVAPIDRDAWSKYVMKQGRELFAHGREFGDNSALLEAIAIHRSALDLVPQEHAPLDWAAMQDGLGNALAVLGEREADSARLEQAVAAYHAALTERTRRRVPLDWATTQTHLGTALAMLGRRESGTARLKEAVAAYRAALKESSRTRAPRDWATTQNNLGTALSVLGERERGTARLKEAVAVYHAVLKEWTLERVPFDWALTQSSLGNTLRMIGEREGGASRLEEAVAAFHAALKVWTRERAPLDWAMTQNNLGGALVRLSERESGTERLTDAIAALRAALKEWTRERVPLDWAGTQNNLGNALSMLWEREGETEKLEEAVAAFRAALEVWTRERVPLYWAMSTGNQGVALMRLAEQLNDLDMARAAVQQITMALETMSDGGHAAFASYYRKRLPEARVVLDRLDKR